VKLDTSLDFALAYAGAGYRVIPVRGKIPLTEHGAHDATTDETVIRAWWGKYADANIGMTLDGLVVVDVDPRNGGDIDLLPYPLPETCYAKTGGGGWHYLYRARNGTKYHGTLCAGIDIKHGAGSYIVVEPSIHASGEKYCWLDELEPWTTPPAEAPEWLANKPDTPKAKTRERGGNPVELIENIVDGNALHDSTCALAAHYAALGISFAEICKLLELAMHASKAPRNDRWQARFDAIPGLANSAITKFRSPLHRATAAGVSGMTANELLHANMPELRPLYAPWLYEGTCLLASAPKTGKTTLARQLSEAGGIAGAFLNSKIEEPFRTCFFSLEEGARLFLRKLKLMKIDSKAADLIDVFFEWPPGFVGCELLAEHLKTKPGTRLVVIDSLSRFRPPTDKGATQFQADYDIVMALSAIAKQFPGLVILIIHHTRKMRGVDAMDDISGTYGLTAAADAFLVMRKQGKGATLHAGGRMWDQDDSDFELTRDGQRWFLQGVSDGLTSGERFTLKIITEAGGMGPTELSKALDCTRQNAYQRLDALLTKGNVEKRNGNYISITT
jgi:hypothetical protein